MGRIRQNLSGSIRFEDLCYWQRPSFCFVFLWQLLHCNILIKKKKKI